MSFGYSDETVGSNKVFGLNQKANIVTFEWINTAGKGGSEGEALEIKVLIQGDTTPISYRQYPITKVTNFNDGSEITDPEHPLFKKAEKIWAGNITHIMKSLGVTEETMKEKLSVPIPTFKEYCKILMSMLPKNFATKPVDVFLQYQSTLRGKMTFLELPKNPNNGKFLVPAVKPVGAWKELKDVSGLKYVDDENNVHPFKRTAKYLEQKSATQQFAEDEDVTLHGDSASTTGETSEAGASDDW